LIHIFAVNPPLSLNDLILTALVALVIGCALANWGGVPKRGAHLAEKIGRFGSAGAGNS
jgi:hypothetical protein